MPAGWKPITVQKIIQIQSNLEYCILTACDWRRWDGNAIYFFLSFLFFFKIPIKIFNAQQTSGDCKYIEVFDCAKSPDGFQTKAGLCVCEGGGVIFSQCKLLISSSDVFGLSCQLTLN